MAVKAVTVLLYSPLPDKTEADLKRPRDCMTVAARPEYERERLVEAPTTPYRGICLKLMKLIRSTS